MEEQLNLHLNDDMMYADACYHRVKNEYCNEVTHPHLFPSTKYKNKMWLGTRTSGYETDYDRLFQINKNEAAILMQKYKDIGCFDMGFLEYANRHSTNSE